MSLLKASRALARLKTAASVPDIPGLAGPGGAHVIPVNPAGTQGRLKNLAAPRAKLKSLQAPRAYAPRMSPPSP